MHLPLTLCACLAPGVLGLAILAHSLYRRLRPQGPLLCPGPRRLLHLLNPLNWLLLRACRYNLSGLPRNPCGQTICPECARQSTVRQSLRTKRRWRPTTVTCLLLALSIAMTNSQEVRTLRILRRLPTFALIPLAYIPAKHRPPHISSELRDRLSAGSVVATQINLLIPALIRDLRDDTVRWNGLTAIDSLTAIGPPAFPELRAALDSDDWQQRQLAAHLLRSGNDDPSDALLRVTLEGLRDDALPEGPARGGYGFATSWINNGQSGLRWLARCGSPAALWLSLGMASGDPQQRFLSALAAAFSGQSSLVPQAAPILIDHLRSNNLGDDASAASAALYQFGPLVAPRLLILALTSRDRQQRSAARLILLDLALPPRTDDQLAHRSQLNRLTNRVYDPVMELGLDNLGW